jgi:hypothetical protein
MASHEIAVTEYVCGTKTVLSRVRSVLWLGGPTMAFPRDY